MSSKRTRIQLPVKSLSIIIAFTYSVMAMAAEPPQPG